MEMSHCTCGGTSSLKYDDRRRIQEAGGVSGVGSKPYRRISSWKREDIQANGTKPVAGRERQKDIGGSRTEAAQPFMLTGGGYFQGAERTKTESG